MLLRYIPSLPAVLLFLLRGSRFWFWNILFGEECLITCFDFLFLEYFIWWRMFDHLFGFFGFGIFYLMKNVWSPVWIFDFGIFYLVKNVWSPVLILEYFIWWRMFDHLFWFFYFGIFYLMMITWGAPGPSCSVEASIQRPHQGSVLPSRPTYPSNSAKWIFKIKQLTVLRGWCHFGKTHCLPTFFRYLHPPHPHHHHHHHSPQLTPHYLRLLARHLLPLCRPIRLHRPLCCSCSRSHWPASHRTGCSLLWERIWN